MRAPLKSMPYTPTRKTYRKPAAAPRKKYTKRWYFDASIPKGVPLIGGSSLKMGSGTMTKRSIQTLKSLISENKQKIVSNNTPASWTHNTIYTFNPLSNIPIGAGENSRIGASIHVKSIRLNYEFTTFGASNPDDQVMVRLMWVKNIAQGGSGTDIPGSFLASSDLFLTTSGGNGIKNIPDFTRSTVISDQIVRLPTSHVSGRYVAAVGSCDMMVPFQFHYNSPTSNYGKDYNYYLVLIPYVAAGTTGTTIAGTVRFDCLTNFTDA